MRTVAGGGGGGGWGQSAGARAEAMVGAGGAVAPRGGAERGHGEVADAAPAAAVTRRSTRLKAGASAQAPLRGCARQTDDSDSPWRGGGQQTPAAEGISSLHEGRAAQQQRHVFSTRRRRKTAIEWSRSRDTIERPVAVADQGWEHFPRIREISRGGAGRGSSTGTCGTPPAQRDQRNFTKPL